MLNQALRANHEAVPKFMPYLRLLLDALKCMPKKPATLWRGIAADLYDEYEVGKELTWWTVSSCTADEEVARSFMAQLGGGAATLLTLETTCAAGRVNPRCAAAPLVTRCVVVSPGRSPRRL